MGFACWDKLNMARVVRHVVLHAKRRPNKVPYGWWAILNNGKEESRTRKNKNENLAKTTVVEITNKKSRNPTAYRKDQSELSKFQGQQRTNEQPGNFQGILKGQSTHTKFHGSLEDQSTATKSQSTKMGQSKRRTSHRRLKKESTPFSQLFFNFPNFNNSIISNTRQPPPHPLPPTRPPATSPSTHLHEHASLPTQWAASQTSTTHTSMSDGY